jgi:hypothetical protein
MNYKGSCHCGRIKFEIEGSLESAVTCNCSMCQRKGAVMWFVPRDKLRLLTPEQDASTYLFNKHAIKHRYCSVGGIHPYGEGADPKGMRTAAVNIRCLEGIELESIPTKHYDGRSL